MWSKDTTPNAVSIKYEDSPRVVGIGARLAVPAIPARRFTPVEKPEYNQGFAVRKAYLFSSDSRSSFECHIPLEHFLNFPRFY